MSLYDFTQDRDFGDETDEILISEPPPEYVLPDFEDWAKEIEEFGGTLGWLYDYPEDK